MAKSMDTQLQNFWKESINKEAALRFSWHLRYSRQFSKETRAAATKSASDNKTSDGKKKAAARHSSVPNGNTVAERIRRLESSKQRRDAKKTRGKKVGNVVQSDPRLAQSDGALSLRDMRPPSAGTRQLLYNGISAHGDGRYAYLKKRKTLTPEEKYDFPMLSSCQYGWKIRDFEQAKSSPHARVCVIKDSFYRNSGIILG